MNTQTAYIVELLRSRRGDWIALSEILALHIAQYGARIYQARHEWGLKIENKTEVRDGVRHSWFRLVEEQRPAAAMMPARRETIDQLPAQPKLFAEGR